MREVVRMKVRVRMIWMALAALLALYAVPVMNAYADEAAATSGNVVAQVVSADGTTTDYGSLKAAVDAAPAGATVNLLADTDIPATSIDGTTLSMKITSALTLNGNGHTLTVHGRGIYLYGGANAGQTADITMKNLTILNPDPVQRAVSARDGYKKLTFEDVVMKTTGAGNTQVFTVGGNTPQTTDIAFIGCTLEAAGAGYGIVTFNPVNMTIADTQISGYAALYMKGQDASAGSTGSTVNINNGSVLTGIGIAGETNVFGTVVFEDCTDVHLNVEDATLTADASSDEPPTPHGVIMYSHYQNSVDRMAQSDTVTFEDGSHVNANGANSVFIMGNGTPSTIDANAGTFHLEGQLFEPADDPEGAELIVTGGTWNKDMKAYVPDGFVAVPNDDGSYSVLSEDEAHPATPTQPSKPDDPATPAQPASPDASSGSASNAPSASTDKTTPPAVHSGATNNERQIKRPVAVTEQGKATSTPSQSQAQPASKQGSALEQTGDAAGLQAAFAVAGIGVSLAVIAVLAVFARRARSRG